MKLFNFFNEKYSWERNEEEEEEKMNLYDNKFNEDLNAI